MENNYYSLNYKGSHLMAVPAVHYRSAFANQVHIICRDKSTRPDAIVVELGHALVTELIIFLSELKQGGKHKEILPMVLGIMMRNRYIHPEYYEKAMLLQEFYRSSLYDLPDDVLAERLNFNKWSTLYISPTDSIIEAVRCAMELDIAVYGVDLTDIAALKPMKHSIEDPYNAHCNVLAYSNRMIKYCDASRDPRIDFNREVYMVSGLKHSLSKHKKVLFTCGMAHWNSLVSLMADDNILPFPVHEIPVETEFKRVIIHPSLAIQSMEIIPQLCFDYECNRFPVDSKQKENKEINAALSIRNSLDEVYMEYTSNKQQQGKQAEADNPLWSDIGIYEHYLYNLTAVKQRKLPDIHLMISAAEGMMNADFSSLLSRKLKNVSPDWVSQKDFPDLPVIGPPPISNSKTGHGKNKFKVRMKYNSEDEGNGDENSEEDFYTNIPDQTSYEQTNINKNWEWENQSKKKDQPKPKGGNWIWPPCESLMFGLAFKAAEIAYINQERFYHTQAFDGSLEAGVNVKATIRSYIQGEKRVYINKIKSSLEQAILNGSNPDPFVFIFDQFPDISRAQWAFLQGGFDIHKYVKNTEYHKKIVEQHGDIFVSSVAFEENVASLLRYSELGIYVTRKYGNLMFGNPCINAKQGAIWLESTTYKCCPILKTYSMDTLMDYYAAKFKIFINLSDWQESLIRMAIPFAKKMVTIVAPDSFHIPKKALTEAANRKIALNVVGFSNFSEAQLEEARNYISIPTTDRTGMEFIPEAEELLNQNKELYFEMLPLAVRKQVVDFENISK
jgi:hypothetical protein